eukprot:610066-Pleurochrysis_carterae.AAC.2
MRFPGSAVAAETRDTVRGARDSGTHGQASSSPRRVGERYRAFRNTHHPPLSTTYGGRGPLIE